ncbi:hypothetical protein Patl1_26072 [Pistacia atlantica]|uniref:Uncharacterized protein n=1 Tax=Pistacia atlantica TaxID=434234 RepID=A0ACC1AZJ2_9ROSI|nr:hypothetical protein Patl1_26072 [Pistacia atlantica]
MSRCFPFPPPGYEKKARTGDSRLTKKDDASSAFIGVEWLD